MSGKWTGGIVTDADGDGPPTVEEWVPVSVPGRSATFAGVDGPIAYRTTFADPRSHPAERTRLALRGAYGRARIWINGTDLGEHGPYFVPTTLEFDPQETNELIVVCTHADDIGGLYGTDAVPAETAVPGIWWDAELQVRPTTFVSSLAVTPRLTDDGAVIDTEVTIDAGEAVDDAVTLSLRPEGFRGGGSMERVAVRASAGEQVTASKSLEVREPSLWWPRGYGPQHRYTVRAKLGENSAERTVGLRTIERDDEGLLVNGRRIRARGFNRLPSVGGTDRDREDVRRVTDANGNLVRVRGHVPSPEFYAACDETGVLVWQDLPFPTGSEPGRELEGDRASTVFESVSAHYGFHPSLALYGVQDDPVEPFSAPLRPESGFLSKLAFRWRMWRTALDRGDAKTGTAVITDGRPVVPVAGQPGLDPDATHLSPGWRYLEASDINWLLERYPTLGRVVGDVEAGSVTAADRDATSIPGLDATILERRAPGLEESQVTQSRTLKMVTEALRRRGCGILVAGTLRDVTPGGGMGVLANDGAEKPAYDALTASYEPRQVVLDGPIEPGPAGLTLVNDTDGRVDVTVTWRAGDATGEVTGSADPLETVPVGSIEIPADATEIVLEGTAGDRPVKNTYRL